MCINSSVISKALQIKSDRLIDRFILVTFFVNHRLARARGRTLCLSPQAADEKTQTQSQHHQRYEDAP